MRSELYPQVLGKGWLALAPSIRSAHSVGRETSGVFHISHGTSWLARQLARWSDLPPPSSSAETQLKIVSEAPGERWERRFAAKFFTTRQWLGSDGLLVERVGEWELHFQLRVNDGSLFYDQTSARLCVGKWSMPMPLACAPRVSACEIQDGATRVRITVKVTLPLIGILISYEGYLNVKEDSE